MITETWLSPNILNSEIFPRGYTIFQKDRIDGFGGVLIASRNGIICSDVNIDSSTEIIACKVTYIRKLSVCDNLFTVYRSPERNFVTMENFCQALESLCSRHPNLPIWIGGDLNLPNVD